MARGQTGAIDAFTRNFAAGYELSKDMSQRNAARELANISYDDDKYVIAPDAASEQTPVNRYRTEDGAVIPANPVEVLGKRPEDAGEMVTEEDVEFAYGEGGEARNIEELLNADKATGVLDDSDPQYGVNALDRAAQGYQKVPKAKVLDWEAYKKDRADAYARAGMHEKAANIDTEVDELKRRKFLEYTSRAIQVWDQDPARAAEFLTMANQFNADGTNSVYVPNPNGQTIMEVDFDEMTHKPLGQGSPIDKRVIQEIAMQYADPVKYGYYQLDREWAAERAKAEDEQWDKMYKLRYEQFEESIAQHLDDMGYRYTALEQQAAVEQMKENGRRATDNGYTQQQWDTKVKSLNDFITDVSDPMKFRNEFGDEYQFGLPDEDGKVTMNMPDMAKLRGGAEAFMSFNTFNRQMSPQTAVDLYLMVTTPTYLEAAKAEGRYTGSKTGQPIVKGRDGKWYNIPPYSVGPTPQGQ